mgnify:CR=1 FL=1
MSDSSKNVEEAYVLAKERYAELGVDTDVALDRLAGIPISLHCWQGDDVGGASVHAAGGPVEPRGGSDPELRREVVAAVQAEQARIGGDRRVAVVGGEAHAYSLWQLDAHEIVNDTVAGAPVAITYCPLCNSALVFDRRLTGPDGDERFVPMNMQTLEQAVKEPEPVPAALQPPFGEEPDDEEPPEDIAAIYRPVIRDAIERIGFWAYEQVEAVGGQVWVRGKELEALGTSWRNLFT